jgi:flagellar hook-associated protein 3 FlgL
MLDEDFSRVNFARAELGHREQTLDILRIRLEAEDVELKSTLSDEIDVDLVEAVSELTARQANMQATLQLVGKMLQMNLMDFL